MSGMSVSSWQLTIISWFFHYVTKKSTSGCCLFTFCGCAHFCKQGRSLAVSTPVYFTFSHSKHVFPPLLCSSSPHDKLENKPRAHNEGWSRDSFVYIFHFRQQKPVVNLPLVLLIKAENTLVMCCDLVKKFPVDMGLQVSNETKLFREASKATSVWFWSATIARCGGAFLLRKTFAVW